MQLFFLSFINVSFIFIFRLSSLPNNIFSAQFLLAVFKRKIFYGSNGACTHYKHCHIQQPYRSVFWLKWKALPSKLRFSISLIKMLLHGSTIKRIWPTANRNRNQYQTKHFASMWKIIKVHKSKVYYLSALRVILNEYFGSLSFQLRSFAFDD